MNHIPRYPVRPITKCFILPATTIVTDRTVTENSQLIYEVPITSEGALLQNIIINAHGTTSTASVVRLLLNNGFDYNVATNNALYSEHLVPAKTASTTIIASRLQYVYDLLLPPKFRIYVNKSANAGVALSVYATILEY